MQSERPLRAHANRGNQRGEFRERKGMREEREAEGWVALGWGRGWDGVGERGARGGRGHTLMRATRRWAMREARLEGSSAWLFGHTLLEVAV
jgi:hypothetical protein